MGAFSLPGAVAMATRGLQSDGRVSLARTGGRLRVTGTVRAEYTVAAAADCPGSDFGPVGVAANQLRRGLAAAGDRALVALAGEGRVRRLEFECDAGRVALGVSDEPPPEVEIGDPRAGGVSLHTMPAPELRRALGTVLPYVAPDSNRYGLNGVHSEADPSGGTLLLGVDGNRLCAARAPDEFPVVPRGTLIRRPVAEAILLDGWGGKATLVVTATHLAYSSPCLEIRSTLLKADFPNWRQVVPGKWAHRVDIAAAEIQAVARASRELGGPEDNPVVCLTIDPDVVHAQCRWRDLTCCAQIAANTLVDARTVGLNARFLDEATRNLAGARVTLEMTDAPLGPVRVRDADDPDGPLVILMPVRID